MSKQKVKIKNNRPTYWPIMGMYKIDYSVDGERKWKLFNTHAEGTEWIKTTFPEWFKKNYKQTVN